MLQEILTNSKLNYRVVKSPLYYTHGDDVMELEDKFATVRADTGEVLGIVGDRYKVVQNQEAFSFLEELFGEMRYVKSGVWDGGKKCFVTLQAQSREVLGDLIDNYVIFVNSFDGSTGLTVAISPMRVVCMNILTLGLRKAFRKWTVKHTAGIEGKIKEARQTLQLTNKYIEHYGETAQEMFEIPLTPEDIDKFLIALYPGDEINSRSFENAQIKRVQVKRALNNPDLNRFKETGWGVYNAVSYTVCHLPPLRLTQNWQENRDMSLTMGHPVLEKAQQLIMSGSYE